MKRSRFSAEQITGIVEEHEAEHTDRLCATTGIGQTNRT